MKPARNSCETPPLQNAHALRVPLIVYTGNAQLSDRFTAFNKALLALKSFPGVYRRMNLYKWRDAYIIDDHAHHPSEINSVFETIKAFYPKQKNCVVFQPHLYSRTRDFINDFITVLSKFDQIRLIDIYPAREKPIDGVSVEILLEGITNKKAKYIQKNQVKNELKDSDATIFALLGAGDIGEVIKQFKNEFVIT